MISIVMPVWNRKRFVIETIESVMTQTYKDFEFIIVDDGSTDGIREWLREFAIKDKRVRLILQKHLGPTEAFNTGFKAMEGDYVCILGSDDLWFPNKLEIQMKATKEFPDYILHTKSIRINENNEELGKAITLDATPEGYRKRAREGECAWFITTSLFIPRKMFDKVGLFKGVIHDYQWVMEAVLLHNMKMKLIPEYLTKNRTNPDSNTYRLIGGPSMVEYGRQVKEMILEKLK